MAADIDVWSAELDRLHARIGRRFARSEPPRRAGDYLAGLVAGLDRKNGWTLAGHAGNVSPDGMQRLLRSADWSGRAAVLVDQSAEDIDPFDVCGRLSERLDGCQHADRYRHLQPDTAMWSAGLVLLQTAGKDSQQMPTIPD